MIRRLSLPLLSLAVAALLQGCVTSATFPNVRGASVPQATGLVTLPKGNGPFPAVIIVHGCSGVRQNATMWADFLKENGYASIVMDGFSPRGINEICTRLDRLPSGQRVFDAYAALRYLGTRPEIDADRVAIMGFSNGAGVALDAVLETWVGSIPEVPKTLKAAIALYPECLLRTANRPLYQAPAMILIGEADDWTLASSCEKMATALDPKSRPLTVKTYPHAHHAFDDPTGPGYLSHVQNRNAPNGRGATVRGDSATTEQAKKDVLQFLKANL
jgi:dienelactone hydrolase